MQIVLDPNTTLCALNVMQVILQSQTFTLIESTYDSQLCCCMTLNVCLKLLIKLLSQNYEQKFVFATLETYDHNEKIYKTCQGFYSMTSLLLQANLEFFKIFFS